MPDTPEALHEETESICQRIVETRDEIASLHEETRALNVESLELQAQIEALTTDRDHWKAKAEPVHKQLAHALATRGLSRGPVGGSLNDAGSVTAQCQQALTETN